MSVNDLSLDHAAHDELLVAALASGDRGDLGPTDAETARRLVAGCGTCARLYDDLRRLALATASLPAPRRERDFRLGEADAARLRARGWRRLLLPLAGPRFAFVQPLGGALAALGLAGLLVATVPSVLQGPATLRSTAGSAASASEAADQATAGAGAGGLTAPAPAVPSAEASAPAGGPVAGAAAAGTASPAPSAGAALAPQAPAPSPGDRFEAAAPGSVAPGSGAGGAAKEPAAASGGAGAPPFIQAAEAPAGGAGPGPEGILAAGSLVLLVVGGGLFVAARSVRRRSGT